MMAKKKILTVLLIEDSTDYAELVQKWLAPQNGVEFILNWTDSLMAGLHRLAKGGVDVILLDLGLQDSYGLATFATTRTHATGIPIVILSGDETESLALQIVQQGAQDYIIKSKCNSDLLIKALLYAVVRSGQRGTPESVPDQGAVIGVMGAKGGVGTTTFACNLAMELRRQTDQSTLLADLDVNAGLVSFLMHTGAQYSVMDLVANIHHLDFAFWERMVAVGPGGVDILRSPNLMGVEDPEVRKIQHVLTLIRPFYRWSVLDLGGLTSLSVSLLHTVTELHLVTMTNVPALYEAKRTIDALLKAGFEPEHLRLIVNQVGETHELSGSELGQIFGVPLYAKLPDAGLELHDACPQGCLLGGKKEYRVQIARLARRIAGLPEPAAGGPVAQLLSLAGKLRRNPKDVASTTNVAP